MRSWLNKVALGCFGVMASMALLVGGCVGSVAALISSPEVDDAPAVSRPVRTRETTQPTSATSVRTASTPRRETKQESKGGPVWVDAHTRADGTRVKGHWRGTPDGDASNNKKPTKSSTNKRSKD